MRKITPFLTFDGRAEEAINFYCSLFKDSKILSMDRWESEGPAAKGSVVGAGSRLLARNSWPWMCRADFRKEKVFRYT